MQTTDPAYSRQLITPSAQKKENGMAKTYRQLEPVMSIAAEHLTVLDGDIVMAELIRQTE